MPVKMKFYQVAIWHRQIVTVITTGVDIQYQFKPVNVQMTDENSILLSLESLNSPSRYQMKIQDDTSSIGVGEEEGSDRVWIPVKKIQWHRIGPKYHVPFSVLSSYLTASQADLKDILLVAEDRRKWILEPTQHEEAGNLRVEAKNGNVLIFDFGSHKVILRESGEEIENAIIMYPFPATKDEVDRFEENIKVAKTKIDFSHLPTDRYPYERVLIAAFSPVADPVRRNVLDIISTEQRKSRNSAHKQKKQDTVLGLGTHNEGLSRYRKHVLWKISTCLSGNADADCRGVSVCLEEFTNANVDYDTSQSLLQRKQLAAVFIAGVREEDIPDDYEHIARDFFFQESTRFLFDFHYPSIGVLVSGQAKELLQSEVTEYLQNEWNEKSDQGKLFWYNLTIIHDSPEKLRNFQNKELFHLASLKQYMFQNMQEACYRKIEEYGQSSPTH